MSQSWKDWVNKNVEEVLVNVGSHLSLGLTKEEAAKRLLNGKNVINGESFSAWGLLVRQFASPLLYILVAAGILALFLGEPLDATMILLFVVINGLLGFSQEYRSEKATQALKKYTSFHSQVKRNGEIYQIQSSELVVGDLVLFEPGDIVQADCRLVEVTNLVMDESVLTGESVTITKNINENKLIEELSDAVTMVFAGTNVISGKGIGVVVATGNNTQFGQIAHLTTQTKRKSSFEQDIGRFANFLLWIVVITLGIVFVAHYIIRPDSTDFGNLLIFSIALAASVIPEALPLVMTFSLSQGASKLAKLGVVVKRLSAIEDLGSIEILCTDKTGTITENKLIVKDVSSLEIDQTLIHAGFCSITIDVTRDPFDLAIQNKLLENNLQLHDYQLMAELPFDPVRKRNSVLVKMPFAQTLISRGAPEEILESTNLAYEDKQKILEWVEFQGKSGRRVLSIASKTHSLNSFTQEDESDMSYLGSIAFEDPLKVSTKSAIAKAASLGVQVKIVTGDAPQVAGSIAYQAGLIDDQSKVITASELEADSVNLKSNLAKYNVFARVDPRQKHWIVTQLQTLGHVGFLGEGINDAPALKASTVGLVVQSASDIAREASDIILMDTDLSVIVEGIAQGRKVFQNTLKYIKITLTANFGNFYAVAIASLMINYPPMLPIQILLLNLLSDFPMISISTDSVSSMDIAKPQHSKVRDIALIAMILGSISTVFDFIVFSIFKSSAPEIMRTNWFMVSILDELAVIYSLRSTLPFYKSSRPSKTLGFLTGGAAVVCFVLPFSPIGRIFSLVPPSTDNLLVIFALVGMSFVVIELAKRLYYHYIEN